AQAVTATAQSTNAYDLFTGNTIAVASGAYSTNGIIGNASVFGEDLGLGRGYPCTTACFTKASTIKSYVQSAATGQSIAANLVHTGAWKPLAITDGSEVACVATTTYVAQMFIPANMTVTGVAIVNGTAVAGNVQVSIADSTGAPITAARSASTAASGTAAYQRIAFASPWAATPGTYYLQLQCNNTSMRFRAHTVGDFRTTTQTSGTYGTFASFTPPTTFTTAVGPVASLY
ncbi:MAG: hypothetical protein ACOZDY_20700, partial [Pseudomonadota bacterium]